jgi:DNA polymerase III epsilon subunit
MLFSSLNATIDQELLEAPRYFTGKAEMSDLLRVSPDWDFLRVRYVVIDVETTGLDALSGDEICELAALPVFGEGKLGEAYETLINPGKPIPPEAGAVNGITDDMVKDKPCMEDITQDFLDFIGDDVLVMHNAPFDMSFIQCKLERTSRPLLENLVIDTLALAKREFGYGGNSLGQLARKLSLKQGEEHRALGDTKTTASLLLHFLAEYRKRGKSTLRDVGARPALDYTPPAIVRGRQGAT